jgi:RNA polymerase sigma factor (sigma-70 family)
MSKVSPPSNNSATAQLAALVALVRAGDPAARNEILNHFDDRLRALTRRMLRGFPDVRRFEETDDIHQRAMLRMHHALKSVALVDLTHFLNLSAVHIRRVLLTLAERYRGTLLATGPLDWSKEAAGAEQVADATSGPEELARWTEFHEAVEALEPKLREVVDLLYYQGLTQPDAAGLLGVSDRTVRARWQEARLTLVNKMSGVLPGS